MPFIIPNTADAAVAGQASPDAQDFAAITQGSGLTGVISGCAATVTGSDMNVTIAAGVVIIGGKEVAVSSGAVAVTSDPSQPRYTIISVNTSGTKTATSGSASSNPVFPSIPANSALLYAVYIPAGDTTIQSNQLTDKRVVVLRDDQYLANLYL